MRTLLLLGAAATLALAGCGTRQAERTPDPVAASPGGPSSTGQGEEDRPLPTQPPGTGPIPDQKPTEQPQPTTPPGARQG